MKKKLAGIIAVAAVLATIAAWNYTQSGSEIALADINPLCPNGCVSGDTHCYCNGTHYHVEEYHWPNN
ncbi:MAG: hypothetical protein LBF62_05340 [Tannerellaceae bacterium]|jgi:hypothetical protein|nr:hypothetical protein [Tannerellaceae bacterium]